jgi:protein-S-isoprenylcysteine O-methyltransferase Ste14
LLYGGTLLVGLALDAAVGADATGLPGSVRWVTAGVAFVAAGALAAAAIRRFLAAGTNVPPSRPATALVTGGVYRFTRNPMYSALTLLYAALALAADAPVTLLLLVPLLLVVRYGVVAREEAYMERKFGDEYRRYKASVRRWI